MTVEATFKGLADGLAALLGKDVTVVEVSQTYDPSTGQTTTTKTDHNVRASAPQDFTTATLDGSLIQSGDTVVDVPASELTFAPDTSDEVKLDGVTWQIVQVGKLYGGGDVAAYRLHARK